ncbi:biotin-independent malonate decarboxylase subunit gamma [Acidisoma cellulosilytica]|uniref:Biotin-independent malonate decarboxylase subunit gamma n=1 Tax=Acidisoma cellulosilyticum TaxID=2802395 RepID=A0A964E4M8_9PROT|nr:biotin-independent malonate decarboxylase subunit gamma [Acidisoma cellulosilyticum]MCB8881432.1 biotin-independent malonate decarboxylase subunit gamma [Acidisoma cellulosilyticum]
MTLDDILAGLFPAGHSVQRQGSMLFGEGAIGGMEVVDVVGIADGAMLGVEDALTLAGRVLGLLGQASPRPILVLVDSASQRMSRHDELMGLSEYLAHLAKSLLLAQQQGHRTVGLLYGGSAAGAFIATALACDTLLALPGAHPAVMDLPSMARVTKLPIAQLQDMAKATPVFAPGLENLAQTGAIHQTLDPTANLADQLLAVLRKAAGQDERGGLGADRGGRPKAASIAARIDALASA